MTHNTGHTPDDEKRPDEERDTAPRWLSLQRFYLHPSDPENEPMDRLIVERDGLGLIDIWEARMSSPSAQELRVHDRLSLAPSAARWLRDRLVEMDLEDHDTPGASA